MPEVTEFSKPNGIADGDDRLAEHEVGGNAHRDRLERLVRLRAEERQVRGRVGGQHDGVERLAGIQRELDVRGAADDVLVGDHQAAGGDDAARAERRIDFAPLRHGAAEEILEEPVEDVVARAEGLQSAAARDQHALGADVDDAAAHFLDGRDDRRAAQRQARLGVVGGDGAERKGRQQREDQEQAAQRLSFGGSGFFGFAKSARKRFTDDPLSTKMRSPPAIMA